MTSAARRLRAVSPERVPWYLIVAAALVLLALALASAGQYASVTQAHANASLDATYAVTIQGTDSRGVVLDNGTIRLAVRLAVTNPSPRVLDFQSITLAAWIGNTTGTVAPSLAFYHSFEANTLSVTPAPVAAWSNGSLSLAFNLNRTSDPARFAGVQQVQSAQANATGTASGIPWNLYALLTLRVEGIPDPIASAGAYELNLNRVILSWGQNLGTGVG